MRVSVLSVVFIFVLVNHVFLIGWVISMQEVCPRCGSNNTETGSFSRYFRCRECMEVF